MEEREEGEGDLAVGGVDDRVIALADVGHQIVMGEHDALRETRGARGVGEHHDVVAHIHRSLRHRLTEDRQDRGGALGAVEGDHLGDAHLRRRGERHLSEHADRDQFCRPGIAQLEGDLLGPVGRVDGGDGAADDRDRVEHDRVLRHVRRHQREGAAAPEASGRETSRECVDGIGELLEGVRATRRAIDQRDTVRVVRHATKHELGDRDLGDVDLGQGAGVDDHRHSDRRGRAL